MSNEFFFLIVSALPIVFIVYFAIKDSKNRKEIKELQRKQQIKRNEMIRIRVEKNEYEYADLVNRFGEPTLNIGLMKWTSRINHNVAESFIVFDAHKLICIYGNLYNFFDILGHSLVDEVTKSSITNTEGNTKSSLTSIAGRSIIGGTLAGGVGALAGAVTSPTKVSLESYSQSTNIHDYCIYVNLNSISNPSLKIKIGDDKDKAFKISNILNVIETRNRAVSF